LEGKEKAGHLTDDGPVEDDPTFKSWDEEDSMIMAWLWNSMVLEIRDTCLYLNSAKPIWIAIEKTYSKAKYAAQMYYVKVKTMLAKKGTKTVTEYYCNHERSIALPSKLVQLYKKMTKSKK